MAMREAMEPFFNKTKWMPINDERITVEEVIRDAVPSGEGDLV